MSAPLSSGRRTCSGRPPPQSQCRVFVALALLFSMLGEVTPDPEAASSSPRPAGMEDLARLALAPWCTLPLASRLLQTELGAA